MSRERELLESAVFIGGVPRSGTTFLARSLNSHPDFVVSADDHVLECWGLYYYKTRVGVVDGLRRGTLTGEKALASLEKHLFSNGSLLRAVPSDKVLSLPLSAPPVRPDGEGDTQLVRHDVPLASFLPPWRLCLKSPEITHVFGKLVALLPSARFIMVYRPLREVAESMYRMGEKVRKVKIFHRRWREEKDRGGRLTAPPGVPPEWADLWPEVTDFQRCVINGASYLRALAAISGEHPENKVFIYNHSVLRKAPERTFARLADFLGVDPSGFEAATADVAARDFAISPNFLKELEYMEDLLCFSRVSGKLLSYEEGRPL